MLSLRNVAASHTVERMKFTVHSQVLEVSRLKIGERKRVRVPLASGPHGEADSMLPAMYFYQVSVARVDAQRERRIRASPQTCLFLP